jgi:hypothetical protein
MPAEPAEGGADCIPEAFSSGLERLSRAVLAAVRGEDGWLERIRVGLNVALGFLDENPQWARLLVLEAPLEGAVVSECARRLQGALGVVLERSRGEVIVGAQLAPPTGLIAELALGGVLSLVRARMLAGSDLPLVALAPLMRDVVEPYLGAGAGKADVVPAGEVRAGAEHRRAPVVSRPRVLPIRATPTYMLALSAITQVPHCSNREIDAATGGSINDGNVAQLLGRLARRGLIENAAAGRGRGHTNAWLITPYGRRALELNRHALPTSVQAVAAHARSADTPKTNAQRPRGRCVWEAA